MAFPAQVIEVAADYQATVEVAGRHQQVSLIALPDLVVAPGDWLLVQAGLAVAPIDADEAAQRRKLLDEITGGWR